MTEKLDGWSVILPMILGRTTNDRSMKIGDPTNSPIAFAEFAIWSAHNPADRSQHVEQCPMSTLKHWTKIFDLEVSNTASPQLSGCFRNARTFEPVFAWPKPFRNHMFRFFDCTLWTICVLMSRGFNAPSWRWVYNIHCIFRMELSNWKFQLTKLIVA